ncbi:MAG: hypothetical protein RLZ12_417 [Bacillota bacterium]|jgi:putative ABC transport system permease protein
MITSSELILSLVLGLIYGLVALGIYLSFRIIDFPDLTCDGSFVLGAASASIVLQADLHPLLALTIAFISGALAGAMTASLNRLLKIPALLSGILVASMLYSVNLEVMGGLPNIPLIDSTTIFNLHPSIPILLILSIFTFVIICLLGYLLNTDLGLALRSLGQNQQLAKHVGINITLLTILGLALSNGLISLGGALLSQYQNFADIGSGIGTLISGLAAVMLGEQLLPFRSVWIKLSSCIIGAVLYRFVIGLALHNEILHLETYHLNLIVGLMMITIFIINRRTRRC